jgi:hypothetical protein
MPKLPIWPGFWKSFIAIVAGNLLYFFVLMPHLPPSAQHARNRLDLGLIIDFWICVVLWGVLDFVVKRWRRHRRVP